MFGGRKKDLSKVVGVTLAISLFLVTFVSGQAFAEESAVENVYDLESMSIELKPLTLVDCARCHPSQFNWLREHGAKHQGVVCNECHEVFHAYNPRHNNYELIMPKCFSCHDAPHGTAIQVNECLACHRNPHQPLASLPAPLELEGRCPLCHNEVAASLQAEPSMHTDQKCSFCHSEKHGRIPVCFDCHENHSPMAVLDTPDCLACHPVHTPLKISYPADQAKEVCGGCHDGPYEMLQANTTKHSAFSCAKCHPEHGYLPVCMDCHGKPHNPAIHEKYAQCGECHGTAHDVSRP